jgi:hypothetical protein
MTKGVWGMGPGVHSRLGHTTSRRGARPHAQVSGLHARLAQARRLGHLLVVSGGRLGRWRNPFQASAAMWFASLLPAGLASRAPDVDELRAPRSGGEAAPPPLFPGPRWY